MKTKERKIIGLIIICVLIIITILVSCIKILSKGEKVSQGHIEELGDARTQIERTVEIKKVTIPTTFYTVQSIIEKYLSYENNGNKADILNLLDADYIKENNITVNNLEKFITINNEEIQNIITTDMRALEGNQFKRYSISIIATTKSGKSLQQYYIVTLDEYNSTYMVKPIFNVKNIEEIKIEELQGFEKIEDKGINVYSYVRINDSEMAKNYFKQYKELMLNAPSKAYDQMEEEYKVKRFGSLANYEEYLKVNSEELKNATATQFLVDNSNESSRFVIKDQYSNMYIFKIKSVMDYTVRLDTYTITEEKFNTTYDLADSAKKVQMNIDKFFQMINRHDYKTSYNVLAKSFKSKSIKTEREFENIAKKIFFTYNKVEFTEFDELGDNTYAYKIKLTDLIGRIQGEKNIRVIMQLQDERKFAMSFSLE